MVTSLPDISEVPHLGFEGWRRWFEDTAKRVGTTSVYNCTEGGAYIAGMDHRPLAEVLALLDRELDVAGELDAAAMTVDATRTPNIVEHLTGYSRGLRRSRRLARIARTVIQRGDAGNRLPGLEAGLTAALQPLTFISLLAQRELERAQDIARRPAEATDYLAASASLLDTLLEIIEQVEPALKAALDRLGPRRSHGRAA